MVSTFFMGTAVALLITAALTAPLVFVARRAGRRRTVMRFLVGALVVALVCGLLEVGSERLTDQCLAQGNPPYACNSYGERGMQAVFVVGFAIVALLNAWWLRDARTRRRTV